MNELIRFLYLEKYYKINNVALGTVTQRRSRLSFLSPRNYFLEWVISHLHKSSHVTIALCLIHSSTMQCHAELPKSNCELRSLVQCPAWVSKLHRFWPPSSVGINTNTLLCSSISLSRWYIKHVAFCLFSSHLFLYMLNCHLPNLEDGLFPLSQRLKQETDVPENYWR